MVTYKKFRLELATCETASRRSSATWVQLCERSLASSVIASTKMEQKPVFEKPENKGIKSHRPTYAGAWPRRMILRCISAAAASLAKRGPHTAASYDAHSMSELLDGYATCSLDNRMTIQTINLDVSGWSPNFLLVTITYIYMVLLSALHI